MITQYIRFILLIFILSFSYSNVLDFEYGLIGKKTKKSKRLFEVNNNDTLSNAYTKLNLKINDSYFYLILKSHDGIFEILFKAKPNLNRLSRGSTYIEIPWMNLSSFKNGIDLYLLSTADELLEIENLIHDYSFANKRNKKRFGKKLISLLDNLNNNSNLSNEDLESKLDSQIMTGVTFRATTSKRIESNSLLHSVNGDSDVIFEVITIHLK